MTRAIVRLSLVLLSSRLAFPQTASKPTPGEMLASSLADMHGLREAFDNFPEDRAVDLKALWFSVLNSPMASAGRPDGAGPSAQGPPPAVAVSAKRLRHRVPKAARKAYEKANKIKDVQKEAQELEKAIAFDPDFEEAHSDLGVAYTFLGRYPEAAAEFRRAIELIPEDSLPYSNLAWLMFATGQRAEAWTNVRRALQLSPENPAARRLIGRLGVETSP